MIDSFGLYYHHFYDAIPLISKNEYPDLFEVDSNDLCQIFGIYSNSCVGSDISDDSFYWNIIDPVGSATQIYMVNSGGSLSRIYHNTFRIDAQPIKCGPQGYFANFFIGDNAGLSILCNKYNVRPWNPVIDSERAICWEITIGDWYIADYISNYSLGTTQNIYLPAEGSYGEGAANQFTNYNLCHRYDGNAMQTAMFGCGEDNIEINDNNGTFYLTYYNYHNWTDTLGDPINDLYPAVINTASISRVIKDTSLYGSACGASYCMNYLVAADYIPPSGPPAAPFQVNNETGAQIFPNPTTGILNVQYNFDFDNSGNEPLSIQLQIVDFSGKTIETTLLNQIQGSMILDTKLLSSGVYFYRFMDTHQNKVIDSGKFAVSR